MYNIYGLMPTIKTFICLTGIRSELLEEKKKRGSEETVQRLNRNVRMIPIEVANLERLKNYGERLDLIDKLPLEEIYKILLEMRFDQIIFEEFKEDVETLLNDLEKFVKEERLSDVKLSKNVRKVNFDLDRFYLDLIKLRIKIKKRIEDKIYLLYSWFQQLP